MLKVVKSGVFSALCTIHRGVLGPRAVRRADLAYETRNSRRLTMYRLANAHVTNSRCAFFSSPL